MTSRKCAPEDVARFEISRGSDGFQIHYREPKRWFPVGPPHPFYFEFEGRKFPTQEAAEQALKDRFDREIVAIYAVKS